MQALNPVIFVGPQLRSIDKKQEFEEKLNSFQHAAWTNFVKVVQNFVGYTKAPNYRELVESILKSLKNFGANMSIKVHYLDNHFELKIQKFH